MNLLFAYVDNEALCRAMTEIVNEELDHFHQVIDLLKRRDIRFRRLKPATTAGSSTTSCANWSRSERSTDCWWRA